VEIGKFPLRATLSLESAEHITKGKYATDLHNGNCFIHTLTSLVILLIFYALGGAGLEMHSKRHRLELANLACLSSSPMEGVDGVSPSCRPEPPLLEKLSNALGRFAAAMRDPHQ